MIYQNLYKTIDTIASRYFPTEVKLLTTVIDELVTDRKVRFNGGRLWVLDYEKKEYKLIYQSGRVRKIEKNFIIKIFDYPNFKRYASERTIIDTETNPELIARGIDKFFATGAGNKIKIDNNYYYEYLLAFNSLKLDSNFKYSLDIIATVLTSKLKQWRSASVEKNLKADIDKARQLQRSILPQHEFQFHDYDLYGITFPAEIVGGDFFDYIESGADKDRLAVVLGDAASKGVGAAAEAMYISGALRMASTFEIKIAPFMKRINELVNKIFTDDKFASLFYGELSADKNGLFLFANAGHNPPIFLDSATGQIKKLNPTGTVLGPSPKAHYTVENINFNPGDILLIYSDGITESTNEHYHEFGEKRLEQLLKKFRKESAKKITVDILDAVIKFSSNGKYNDDKTVVVIKKKSK